MVKRAPHATAFILGLFLALIAMPVFAANDAVTYSLQIGALAPNAGGQTAYALRRATDEDEWFLFQNQYLSAGPLPLIGVGYDRRFPICDQSCFWQFYVQVGGGVSTAGPMVEILWGTNLFWLLRIDVGTHFYVTKERVITWSYPLWTGISLPL